VAKFWDQNYKVLEILGYNNFFGIVAEYPWRKRVGETLFPTSTACLVD